MADVVIATLIVLLAGVGASAAAAGLVDPTEPPPGYRAVRSGDPQSQEAAPEPVRLQMIARNGAARIAVVNGHRVRTGETVALDGKNVTVAAIRDDSVVLDRGGHQQILELTPRAAMKAVCVVHSSDRPGCRNDALGARP
jgi:hypothetical protein